MSNFNDAPRDPHNAKPEHKKRVRGFLNEQLKRFGVDCDSLHINIAHSLIRPEVISSQSLHVVGLECLDRGYELTYVQGTTAIFTRPWTFEDEHRFHKLSLYDAEKILDAMLSAAKYQWDR